ncbi:unnamed protein product, partial [Amoebophrya sp. A120]|eukprot:GSA120T00009374001.1
MNAMGRSTSSCSSGQAGDRNTKSNYKSVEDFKITAGDDQLLTEEQLEEQRRTQLQQARKRRRKHCYRYNNTYDNPSQLPTDRATCLCGLPSTRSGIFPSKFKYPETNIS